MENMSPSMRTILNDTLMSKKGDFWDFVTALKLWLERNTISYEIVLARKNSIDALHGKKLIEPPPISEVKSLPPVEKIISPGTPTPVIDAKRLISQKPTASVTANSIFSTKQRRNLGNGQPLVKVEEINGLQC